MSGREGASHKGSLETFPDDSIKQYRNIIEIAIGGRKSCHWLLFIYMNIETDIINMTYRCRVYLAIICMELCKTK